MDETFSLLRREVLDRRPVLEGLLLKNGERTLGEYIADFNRRTPCALRTWSDEFANLAARSAGRILGSEIEEKLLNRLRSSAAILTANHCGPEFLNILVQGDILFSLAGDIDSVVPVFAFGGVPLNNLSYPRGILGPRNIKIPIFPDRLKDSLVSVTPAFTREMIEGSLSGLNDKHLSENEAGVIRDILNACLAPQMLSVADYPSQVMLMNQIVWRRLFAADTTMPQIAYIEMESLVSQLLERDFSRCSLADALFFDPAARNSLMVGLEGIPGCWNSDTLHALNDQTLSNGERRKLTGGSGTAFFWGVSTKGCRFPLALDHETLHGVDPSGEAFELEWSKASILEALSRKSILPSLFTCFLEVAFARGYHCYGGFMQVDYLTRMKEGVHLALVAAGKNDEASIIVEIPTENYVAGIMPVISRDSAGNVSASGSVEIMDRGGLTNKDMNVLRSMKFEHVVESSFLGAYPVVVPRSEQRPELLALGFKDVRHSSLLEL